MLSAEREPTPPHHDAPLTSSRDRVDTPQQYTSWRDYAFSEYPERDAHDPESGFAPRGLPD